MTDSEVKKAVQEQYGKIALQSGSCCGPSCGCGPDQAEPGLLLPTNSYTDTDKQIVAQADLGLGCGTPTAFADMREGMTVLDLGSGAGIDVFLAAKQVGPTGMAIGLDMTDEMLDRAEANKRKLDIANAEFRKGEIENMPVESGTIDRVISNCVINLVPNKRKAFSEIHRVLKPGGRFTVSDIVSVGRIPENIRKNMLLWAGCIAGAVEKAEYIQIIKDAGFTDVRIVTEKPYSVPDEYHFGVQSITVSGTK
jgi:ubiquinone/menaquinone biosynthesis C-methylase UbiE